MTLKNNHHLLRARFTPCVQMQRKSGGVFLPRTLT